MKNNTKNFNAFANRKITVELKKKNHTIRKGRKGGTKEQQQQKKRYNGRCKLSQSSH